MNRTALVTGVTGQDGAYLTQLLLGKGYRVGNVDKLSIPFWVPGGAKAVSVIKSRQTARIEKLQAGQTAMYDARKRRCLSTG